MIKMKSTDEGEVRQWDGLMDNRTARGEVAQ